MATSECLGAPADGRAFIVPEPETIEELMLTRLRCMKKHIFYVTEWITLYSNLYEIAGNQMERNSQEYRDNNAAHAAIMPHMLRYIQLGDKVVALLKLLERDQNPRKRKKKRVEEEEEEKEKGMLYTRLRKRGVETRRMTM